MLASASGAQHNNSSAYCRKLFVPHPDLHSTPHEFSSHRQAQQQLQQAWAKTYRWFRHSFNSAKLIVPNTLHVRSFLTLQCKTSRHGLRHLLKVGTEAKGGPTKGQILVISATVHLCLHASYLLGSHFPVFVQVATGDHLHLEQQRCSLAHCDIVQKGDTGLGTPCKATA